MKNNILPRHIAFIMDGNGRWAAKRRLPRSEGHRKGADVVDLVTNLSLEKGIEAITYYAFSYENWSRPKKEVDLLMKLLGEAIARKRKNFLEKDIKFKAIGELDLLPKALHSQIMDMERETSPNKAMTLTLALSYGSRQEILKAAKTIARISGEFTENNVSSHLYTSDLPELDLIVRTSGEKRLSNFLLWQAAYAELYFTDTLWPDFGEEEYLRAIDDFARRERRFGG